MKRFLLLFLLVYGMVTDSIAQDTTVDLHTTAKEAPTAMKKRVYTFDIKDEIGPGVWRQMQKAFAEAETWNADLILLHMNTYGGMVTHADSMRTRILNSRIPVWVFIDNNAASAGALISIACDSIYMRKGANIGAATVVNQTGEAMPDKYQSYMRSMMRSTAEAKGRNPQIAQAMVDESIKVDGISDSGKVLTFTATEALKYGFCEGIHESVAELLAHNGITDYELRSFRPTTLDIFIGWMVNPAISGILIMIIIGGIYFELQTPGVGFPIAASVIAALLYFTPLYLEGLAENWEVVLFLAGVVLLGVEVFVLPGFGVAGVLGAAFVISSLILSLVGNDGFNFEFTLPQEIMTAFLTVMLSSVVGFFGSIYLAKKLLTTSMLSNLVLDSVQKREDGFIGVDSKEAQLVGKQGKAYTVLRPSGKVQIGDEIYDATALSGFIEKGDNVEVVRFETAQLVVKKLPSSTQ